jgi:hypothetical protein
MENTAGSHADYLRERDTKDVTELLIDVLEWVLGRSNTDHSWQGRKQLANLHLNFVLGSVQSRLSFRARSTRCGFDRWSDD